MVSLIFRPKRFRDKNGDIIEMEELEIKRLEIEGDDADPAFAYISFFDHLHYPEEHYNRFDILSIDEIQLHLEEFWNEHVISQDGSQKQMHTNQHLVPLLKTKGKNVSQHIRDCIDMMEYLKQIRGGLNHEEEEQLRSLREKLKNLVP